MTILLFCFSAREHKDFYRSQPATVTSLPPSHEYCTSYVQWSATISQEEGRQ